MVVYSNAYLQDRARQYFLKERMFLESLSTATDEQSKHLVQYATDSQMYTLCSLLYFVAVRRIPMTAACLQKLSRRTKLLLKNLTHKKINDLRVGSREDRVEQVSPFYHTLPLLVLPILYSKEQLKNHNIPHIE